MEKNYSSLIVESANRIVDEGMIEPGSKDEKLMKKREKASSMGMAKPKGAGRGKGTGVMPVSGVDPTKKPAGMLTKASGMAKRGAGTVQNKWGKLSTGGKIGVAAAGVGLAGLAAWKIKKARCKSKCASSPNPQECMQGC